MFFTCILKKTRKLISLNILRHNLKSSCPTVYVGYPSPFSKGILIPEWLISFAARMLSVDSRLPVDSLLVLCCWLPLPVTWLLCLPVLWDCLLSPYRPLERKLNIIECLKEEAEWKEERANQPRSHFSVLVRGTQALKISLWFWRQGLKGNQNHKQNLWVKTIVTWWDPQAMLVQCPWCPLKLSKTQA